MVDTQFYSPPQEGSNSSESHIPGIFLWQNLPIIISSLYQLKHFQIYGNWLFSSYVLEATAPENVFVERTNPIPAEIPDSLIDSPRKGFPPFHELQYGPRIWSESTWRHHRSEAIASIGLASVWIDFLQTHCMSPRVSQWNNGGLQV